MLDEGLSIAIIGAGFSGIGMAIQLKKAGIHSFTVYEAAAEIGGTWRDNTYPGCACDIPSHLYSYSFERKPDWSRKYGWQWEILEYQKHCVAKYGITPHVRLSTKIVRAELDEARGLWTLTSDRGERFEARVVVAGTGPLSRPQLPDVPGLPRFEGKAFHSARWDHDYDLRGKRVAAIGTGASAIQFVPEVAKSAAKLHVFQRTPPWIIPKPDRAFNELEKLVFARAPRAARLYRNLLYWQAETLAMGFVVDPRIMKIAERLARRHIASSLRGRPDLQAAVTPRYTMGCKRVLISNEYYQALARPNVELVTDAVREVTARGVITRGGVEREVDAIVFGTGFDVMSFLAPMEVIGRGGREINEAWREGVEAYYGIGVSGFPNFYILVGPNTTLGHNSMIFMIEAQVHYIQQCIERMRSERLRMLDVRPRAQRDFNARLQDRMKGAVWQSGCKSWYLDSHGKNVALWPGFTFEYWLRTRRVEHADFEAVS